MASVLNSMFGRPANANPEQATQNDAPWLISTGAKAVGSVAGVVSCICGFFLVLDIIDPKCIFSGALLIVQGFFMLLTEAPCCCVFFEFAYMPSAVLDKRPPWIKATIYLIFAAIPFFWCTGVSTFFACGLTMATSALYLMMALGKKADRSEMLAKSSNGVNGSSSMSGPPPAKVITSAPTAVLVQNEEVPVPTKPGYNNTQQVIY